MDEIGKKGGESLKLIRGRSYLQRTQFHRVSLGSGPWRVSLSIHMRNMEAYLLPPFFPSACSLSMAALGLRVQAACCKNWWNFS